VCRNRIQLWPTWRGLWEIASSGDTNNNNSQNCKNTLKIQKYSAYSWFPVCRLSIKYFT
jgi:hypothetical protein